MEKRFPRLKFFAEQELALIKDMGILNNLVMALNTARTAGAARDGFLEAVRQSVKGRFSLVTRLAVRLLRLKLSELR